MININFISYICGGITSKTAFELSTLEKTDGNYYTVNESGFFHISPNLPFFVNYGNSLLWKDGKVTIQKRLNMDYNISINSPFLVPTLSSVVSFDKVAKKLPIYVSVNQLFKNKFFWS